MNRALFALLITFVGAGIVGGLMVVGGPGYARMEKNDRQRVSDLRVLADHYRCTTAPAKTDDGISLRYCGGPEALPTAVDPTTGAAYRYTKSGETFFEVCAMFQTEVSSSNSARRRSFFVDCA
jgi:hypothetical protein